MAIVAGYLTEEQRAIVEAAGYDLATRQDVLGLLQHEETIAVRAGCGVIGLLEIERAGIEVVILKPERGDHIVDGEQALIVNGRHVATSGDGGVYIENTDGFFYHLGRALGIVFQETRTVWVNLDDLGFEGDLPRDWDDLAQAWLESRRAVVIGHASPREAAAIPAGYERVAPEVVREMLEGSPDGVVVVWADCDMVDLLAGAASA
jgi:hypothetical protein